MNQGIRKLLDTLLWVYTLPINAVLRMISDPQKQTTLKAEVFKHLYNKTEYGVLSFYPKSTESFRVRGLERDCGDVAIVLQGPVVLEDHFTVNTVKMYKQFYKNVTVIVSTWADAPEQEIVSLRDAGAIVVLNEYPRENHPLNLNYQLTNSLAGIKKAKELGTKFVCKTRTDQRYYNPYALALLLGRHEPGKITVLGADNNYARYPFWVSDFFAFGEVKELEELYSCPFDTEGDAKKRKEILGRQEYQRFLNWNRQAELDGKAETPPEFAAIQDQFAPPEVKIAYQYYLRKAGPKTDMTRQKAYEDFLRHYATVADPESLGFYWFKRKNKTFSPSYFQRNGKLDMARWMAIQNE